MMPTPMAIRKITTIQLLSLVVKKSDAVLNLLTKSMKMPEN